jgi:hypothetical protein
MDPALIAVGEKALESAASEAKSFLHAVLVEPARELGGLLKDQVSAKRYSNLVKIAVSSKRKLEAAGLSPQEVPLKIIHPLLEQASLEEEPSLQDRWANLLANAAAGRTDSGVRQSFAKALAELTATDARFLDAIYDSPPPIHTSFGFHYVDLHTLYPFSPEVNTLHVRIPTHDMLVSLDSLQRNRLVAATYLSSSGSDTDHPGDIGPAPMFYYVSALGRDFVLACRAPKPGPKS